jgi:SAM-dependent methyltransferase
MGQFTYFDHQLGNIDWTGKRVLDFGGNVGNFLRDPNCRVELRDYWCIDVSRDAIEEGRRRHPDAHFVEYDRYNFEYNPAGKPGLTLPELGVQFDVILAFSVFTHNNEAGSVELVDQLLSLLAADGRLAFTFLDPFWTPPPGWVDESHYPGSGNLHYILRRVREIQPELDISAVLEQAANTALTWATLINGAELIVDQDSSGARAAAEQQLAAGRRQWSYINFCTPKHMRRLFPYARINPPERPERMHCVIIEGRKEPARYHEMGPNS